MSDISGNKAIEDAAVEWVIQRERAAGRNPSDTRYVASAPGDIESPPWTIEVKAFGTSNRGFDLWLEVKQVEEARRNDQFCIYVVENVRQGDPALFRLRVLHGARLRNLIERAKEQRYFTVPWPTADYDTTPDGLPESGEAAAEGQLRGEVDGSPEGLLPPAVSPITPSTVDSSARSFFSTNSDRLDEAARQLGSPPAVVHLDDIIRRAKALFADSMGKSSRDSIAASMDYQTINVRGRTPKRGVFDSQERWNRKPAFLKVGPSLYRRLSDEERRCVLERWVAGDNLLRRPEFDLDQWNKVFAEWKRG